MKKEEKEEEEKKSSLMLHTPIRYWEYCIFLWKWPEESTKREGRKDVVCYYYYCEWETRGGVAWSTRHSVLPPSKRALLPPGHAQKMERNGEREEIAFFPHWANWIKKEEEEEKWLFVVSSISICLCFARPPEALAFAFSSSSTLCL